MSKKPVKKQDPETTGHSWDGIEEFNNPLPRWWLWTLYACIIWGIGYSIAYPAWPLINGATRGVLGYSTRAEVAEDIAYFKAANADLREELVAADLSEVANNPELLHFANANGRAVFATWCSQCHGSGAAGAVGFPNLLDNDWLWGGEIEAINETITVGVRNETNDDARYSEMPAFGDILEEEEIAQVTEFVLSLSDDAADQTMALAGATIFADNCAACHGDEALGDKSQGAPNLADAIWLYGGDRETIMETVTYSRFGVMPAWNVRLSESDIRAVAVYVHGLGGGE
ncbi:cytochrome-c oxidase, cbb3-type subunit III [Falsihalocynthiibacter sp. BN13B15]|uniref:cytochrome-c oxidase, cbb3-type subunit III n=1 Tax=Falsihalocynthiibacter sp. BN13B15 TaxID=3240871 RepID=UPI00351026F5